MSHRLVAYLALLLATASPSAMAQAHPELTTADSIGAVTAAVHGVLGNPPRVTLSFAPRSKAQQAVLLEVRRRTGGLTRDPERVVAGEKGLNHGYRLDSAQVVVYLDRVKRQGDTTFVELSIHGEASHGWVIERIEISTQHRDDAWVVLAIRMLEIVG